jgi:hypothetical protein
LRKEEEFAREARIAKEERKGDFAKERRSVESRPKAPSILLLLCSFLPSIVLRTPPGSIPLPLRFSSFYQVLYFVLPLALDCRTSHSFPSIPCLVLRTLQGFPEYYSPWSSIFVVLCTHPLVFFQVVHYTLH